MAKEIQRLVVERGMEIAERVLSGFWGSLLNIHPAAVRVVGMPMTWPDLGHPGVSLNMLVAA